jgi:beta-phosphoglucomutase
MVTIQLTQFDAAIFDMDGTMINNMQFHKNAWKEFAKRYGMELTDKEFKEKISGKSNDKILHTIFSKQFTKEEYNALVEEKESLYRELYAPFIQEVAGLRNILNELHLHDKKLAIATTAPKKNREFCLEALHLKHFFPIILGDEHITHGKPNPEIYLETAKQLSIKPEHCLVFEDSPPGVAAGKNANMKVIGVLTSHTTEDLKEADYYIKDFTEITFS